MFQISPAIKEKIISSFLLCTHKKIKKLKIRYREISFFTESNILIGFSKSKLELEIYGDELAKN